MSFIIPNPLSYFYLFLGAKALLWITGVSKWVSELVITQKDEFHCKLHYELRCEFDSELQCELYFEFHLHLHCAGQDSNGICKLTW